MTDGFDLTADTTEQSSSNWTASPSILVNNA